MTGASLRVTYVEAWPHRFAMREATLPAGATLADALRALQVDADAPYAIYGLRAGPATPLHDGDRVERLRPLDVDAKAARRRRAEASRQRNG